MPNKVYVINKHGRPLMPCSPAKARHLLDDGKAKEKRERPLPSSWSTEAADTPKKSFWAWTREVRPLECPYPLQKRSCSPRK